MHCTDCSYYWADCDEKGNTLGRPYCHYYHDDGYAPCEVDDPVETDDYDEEVAR